VNVYVDVQVGKNEISLFPQDHAAMSTSGKRTIVVVIRGAYTPERGREGG
jgi:hypothetical protein